MSDTPVGDTLVSDVIIPFQLAHGAVRGRALRLGDSLTTILNTHAYPAAVGELLAETLTMAALLAGSLKYDGIFTLQAQGDGPVRLLVADVTSDGHLRASARFDADQVAALGDHPATVRDLLGGGYLAFTVDQGAETDRYQGIVELTGDTLADCARQYFSQSEQLDTDVRLSARRHGDQWCAGGLMIQRMPGDQPGTPILRPEESQESWRTAGILLRSLTADELTDPALSPSELAYRLFHGEDLTLWAAKPLRAKCRCSRDKIAGALRSIAKAEIAALKDQRGLVSVVCEFCHSEYTFDDAALDTLYAS